MREYTFQFKGPPRLRSSSHLYIKVICRKREATGCSVGHKSRISTWGKRKLLKGALNHQSPYSTLVAMLIIMAAACPNSTESCSCSTAAVTSASTEKVWCQQLVCRGQETKLWWNNQAVAASALSKQQPVDVLGRASAASPDSTAVRHRKSTSCFPTGIV